MRGCVGACVRGCVGAWVRGCVGAIIPDEAGADGGAESICSNLGESGAASGEFVASGEEFALSEARGALGGDAPRIPSTPTMA